MRLFHIFVLVILVLTACSSGTSNTANATGSNTAAVTPSPEKVGGPQTVTIDAPDGVKLIGSFYEAGKTMSPALLLLHQWGSDRHSYDDFAKKMQAAGFNVLAIDGRGFGESTKKLDGTSVSAGRTDADVKAMLGDVDAAFAFLAKQENVYPAKIGIVGASYGSSLALIYAGDNPKVAAVALLSPGLNYFGNMPTEPVIKKYSGDRALLLVAAKDDPDSAAAVSKLLSHVAYDSKWGEMTYEKGGHGTGLFAAQVGLEDTLERFFVGRLMMAAE
jgi:dienelactone hydrolase